MPFDVSRARPLLQSGDLAKLFVEELGWEPRRQKLLLRVGGRDFALAAFAEKRGFTAWLCEGADGRLPDHATRLKLDRELTQTSFEHVVVFVTGDRARQSWMWVRREPGRPARARTHEYLRGQPGDSLLQKLRHLFVSLAEEEAGQHIGEIAARARAAFDVERVTKRFYEEFRRQHAAFLRFITGIPNQGDHEWYASVMLNRLMFLYFIQRKGFLDGDRDYLRHRLQRIQAEQGPDRFYRFYRHFLKCLFHDGLNEQWAKRKPGIETLLGRVPYLNGGIFEVHQLERPKQDGGYGDDIRIPDEAFEAIFDYFDRYQWHLDERPLRADNEINPDVLGYIFEKYINQKQMGAYYTKEDITGYISQNTILPFLFDKVTASLRSGTAAAALESMWQLLRDDPDRYLYPAVRHGVSWHYEAGHPDQGTPLAQERPLPAEISAGLDPRQPNLLERRQPWNKPAPPTHGLPTEIWRETIARRQRCAEVRRKLAAGEVRDLADFITLNLDLRRFAQDVIGRCESPELLAACWHALAGRPAGRSNDQPQAGLTILDPTCGSGAFLFAALNLLEPLYEACLDRMDALLCEALAALPPEQRELSPCGHPKLPHGKMAGFTDLLDQVAAHPNERYFIYKTIILHNLYGVDLMEEAVEICKLRLFLKLAAQVEPNPRDKNLGIEPLPDIDFNIRAGNTLVGYATRAELEAVGRSDLMLQLEVGRVLAAAEDAAAAYDTFVRSQLHGENPAEFKRRLNEKLGHAREQCDRFLAESYATGLSRQPQKFAAWKQSHAPFHWFVEFFGILNAGGFDVIIGNPPYVTAAKAKKAYTVRNLKTAACSDIYAWVLERCETLLRTGGRTGMIVPLSLGFSSDFDDCRRHLLRAYGDNWFSSFGRIPAALFSFDVRVRNTIHIAHKSMRAGRSYTTRLHRWFEAARPVLFQGLEYAPYQPVLWKYRVPKLNTVRLAEAFERALAMSNRTLDAGTSSRPTRHVLHFKKSAYNWLNFCRSMPACYEGNRRVEHTKFGEIYFPDSAASQLALLLANGKLMMIFWFAIGDDFDVTRWNFADFPADLSRIPAHQHTALLAIAPRLEAAMEEKVQFKLNAGRRVGNFNLAKCRHVTDESDAILAAALGFQDAWEDIELYYAQTMKTDFSAADDDE